MFNIALYQPSPDAASKHACEGIAMSYHETYDLDVRIARIFSVFGPEMNRFFIYDFIEKISKDEKSIQLFGTGKQVRDYLHVDDVCRGLLTIMKAQLPWGHRLPSSRRVSWKPGNSHAVVQRERERENE